MYSDRVGHEVVAPGTAGGCGAGAEVNGVSANKTCPQHLLQTLIFCATEQLHLLRHSLHSEVLGIVQHSDHAELSLTIS